jgi:dTDP-4-dehydrorhamnose 3,5-epimerase
MLYQCDGKYDPETDTGIRFDDPDIGIDWPIDEDVAILSKRDLELQYFTDYQCVRRRIQIGIDDA